MGYRLVCRGKVTRLEWSNVVRTKSVDDEHGWEACATVKERINVKRQKGENVNARHERLLGGGFQREATS